MAKKKITKLTVETLKHEDATRKNIPTAEHQSVMYDAEKNPIRVAYERRNRDLDPQLVWRGYDTERHLLYVACTRARDHLLITSGDEPSEFIDDLRM